MKPGLGYNAWHCLCLCVLVLLTPAVGLSIILHPGIGEPNLTTWTDRPVNAVVGRWSSNASFVVVSPKWIITTRHQNTSPATVDINGVTYNCIYNSQWVGGPSVNADIRLIRLKNTDGSDLNLAYYADPYTTADEKSRQNIYTPYIAIGGYGRGRETILYSSDYPSNPYGYTWGTGSNNNNTQRWCTNTIAGYGTADQDYTSDVIGAYFDDPGTTLYEGIPAGYDSGGGWFINVKVGGSPAHPILAWQLAGLTRAVTPHNGQSWYRDPNTGTIPTPDGMDAVRISSYETWINGIINEDCPVGDLDGDCKVNMLDFAQFANWWLRKDCVSGNNFCQWADIQPDGKVDMIDFAFFAQNWLVDKSL